MFPQPIPIGRPRRCRSPSRRCRDTARAPRTSRHRRGAVRPRIPRSERLCRSVLAGQSYVERRAAEEPASAVALEDLELDPLLLRGATSVADPLPGHRGHGDRDAERRDQGKHESASSEVSSSVSPIPLVGNHRGATRTRGQRASAAWCRLPATGRRPSCGNDRRSWSPGRRDWILWGGPRLGVSEEHDLHGPVLEDGSASRIACGRSSRSLADRFAICALLT